MLDGQLNYEKAAQKWIDENLYISPIHFTLIKNATRYAPVAFFSIYKLISN